MADRPESTVTTEWRDASLRAQAVRICCLSAASLAAAYLWAVLFGHGLPGLVSDNTINDTRNLPDANAAFLVAAGAYCLSPVLAWWYGQWWIGWLKWILLTATAGLALIGLSLLLP